MKGPTVQAGPSVEELTTPRACRRHQALTMLALVGSVAIVLLVQIHSASGVVDNTAELRKLLSESYASATQLKSRIGYGGLIHNFKNYVLRPDEDGYRLAAMADAEEALKLIERLQEGAEHIGISAPLTRTREMIESYAARLERVRELTESGRGRRYVDERVRFDDQPAIREVEAFLVRLNAVGEARLAGLQRDGSVAVLLSTVCTAALGALFIGTSAWRQRRQVEAVGALAKHLARSNEELVRANTSLGQFAGIVSHDLKTPLRHIDLFSDLIVEDAQDSEAVDRHAGDIHRQVERMDTIVESLLDFTKTGFAHPCLEAVDLSRLLADIERDLRPQIQQSGARLTFDIDLDEPVHADPALLTRVFSNLIGNGLKYARTEMPASVTVRATSHGEWIELSVSDNGIGIEARFADKIFEPLQRLHHSQDLYAGVGIGLSLAKSVVETHGGQIRLDTNFNDGTRIVFTLPRVCRPERRAAA